MSYDIERFTDLKDLDPEWDDDDVDEIVIMAPKSSGRLPTIVEDLSEVDTAPKTVTLSDFEPLEYSSHAKAKLCRKRSTNRLYALKTFSNCTKSDATERIILNMIDDIRAPFLPPVHWSFRDGDDLHIVVEYYPRDNLYTGVARRGAFRSDHALFYASEIAQGIWALHAAGIVHRDLSLENVLIDTDGHIVLTGFEYASSIERLQGTHHQNHKLAPGGAKENQAPELVLGWTHDFAVDCWGFGILLHLMLSGVHPFREDDLAMTREYLLRKIVRDPIALHPLLEPVARDLISKCLERNPIVRLNINASRKHDYFSAVKWEAVAAKRLQAPHFSDTTGPNFCSGAGYCNNIDYIDLCKHDSCSERKLSQSYSLVETAQTIPTSSRQQHLQELPKVSRMSSLLDDLPESIEETPLNLVLGPSMHGTLISNNLLSENLVVDVPAQERMAQFWETLHSEQASNSVTDFAHDIALRSRKVHKARSSIHVEQRFSTLSTPSLHNKLRKKSRLMSGASSSPDRQLQDEKPPVELPTGVEKIGSGIGFTYTLPAGAGSKASICSNVPPTCHNMLQVRLPVLALGLRLANDLCKTMTKTKTRHIPACEDRESSKTFTQDSHSDDPLSTLVLTSSNSNSSSPVSEAGPLTPGTVGCDECGVVMKGGFEEEIAYEVREGDPVTTLRLVSPSSFQSSEGFL